MTTGITKSIARNVSFMFGSQAVTWISSFVLMMFLPRYLGSEEYGRLFLAISMTLIFEVMINFGGQYHITKETARARSNAPHILVNSVVLRTALWVMSIAVMVAVSVVAGYPATVRNLIIILGVAKLWESISWVMRWCFQGFERMEYPAAGSLVERLLLTAAGVGALLLGATSITIAMVMAISTFVNFLFLLFSIKKIVPFFPKADVASIKKLARDAIPYFLWSAFAVIYYRIDAVMLSVMTPDAVVGWYGAAYRFFDILMFLPSIFVTALFPIISRLWKEDERSLSAATGRSLEFIVVAGVPIAILVFTFARNIIHFFFGLEEYAQSVVLLQIFSAGMLLVYVDFVLGGTVLAKDKQRQWSIVGLLAIPLNVLLNYFLIPYFQKTFANGGIGAAAATLMTETFILVSAIVLLARDQFQMPRGAILLKCLTSGILMGVFLFIMKGGGIFWIAAAILGLFVYVGALVMMKPLLPAEAKVVRDVFSVKMFRQMLTERRGESI